MDVAFCPECKKAGLRQRTPDVFYSNGELLKKGFGNYETNKSDTQRWCPRCKKWVKAMCKTKDYGDYQSKSAPAKLLEVINPYKPFPFDVGSKTEAFEEGVIHTRSKILERLEAIHNIGEDADVVIALSDYIAELEESCQTKK